MIPRFLLLLISVGMGASAADSARRIWADPDGFVPVAISPDGRHIVSAQGTKGNTSLFIEEPGRERRRLGALSYTEVDSILVTPDDSVLFTTANKGFAALRSIALDGTHETEVAKFDEYTSLSVTDLSPDKRTLSAYVWSKGPPQVALISMETHTARILFHTKEWKLAGRILVFSPDGRYLVACRRMEQNPYMSEGRRREIFRIDISDGSASPLIDEANDVFPVAWTPDGGSILYARDLFNKTDLWLQGVRNGQPAGSPKLAYSESKRISPIGLSRSGVLFCYRTPFGTEIELADLDLKRGTLIHARPATTSPSGNDKFPLWSPDGKYLVFSSRHRSGSLYLFNVNRVVQPPGEPRELPKVSAPESGFYGWLNAGDLLVIGNREGGLRMHRVDVRSLAVKSLGPFPQRDYRMGYPMIGRDGAVYYRTDDPPSVLTRKLDGGGEQTILFRLPTGTYARSLRLSPDGKKLAFVLMDDPNSNGKWQAVMTLGTDGRVANELHRVNAPDRIQSGYGQGIAWSQDSQGILFTQGSKDVFDVLYLSLDGGAPRRLTLDIHGDKQLRSTYSWMDVSPDGKTLAFDHGIEMRPELWAIPLSAGSR